MAWYWHQNRQVDQWYRTEDRDKPNKYNFLTLHKGAKICNRETTDSSTDGAGKIGNPYATE